MIRYRLNNEKAWKTCRNMRFWIEVLELMTHRDTVEVRLACDHQRQLTTNGVRECLLCGEQLEVTSHRG